MKTLFVILGLAFAASPAHAADLQYWADEVTHKAYFVARPQVSVQVSNISADDDYWDLITVEVSYSNPKMEEYYNRLKAQLPGYQLNRLILDPRGDFKLSIPAMQVDETVRAMPGTDGPYMNWQGFVPRAKSEAVRRAIVQPGAITVSANAGVTYRLTQTLERVELGVEICQELASREGTFFGVIQNYGKVAAQIDARTFRYPGTKTALVRSVFESCFELPSDSRSGSFGVFLDTRVEPKRNPTRPVGETRDLVPNSAIVPLQMDMVVNLAGGRS